MSDRLSKATSLPLEINVPTFIAKSRNLLSTANEIIFVHKETPKAFEVSVTGLFARANTCWRCSKQITNAKSMEWGLGPDCAEHLGIPWKQQPTNSNSIEFTERTTRRFFLPKSLLTEHQLLTLKAHSVEESGNKIQEAKLWIEKNLLVVKSPFVSKALVEDLKIIDGRKWIFERSVTTFFSTPEVIAKVCETLAEHNLIPVMDSSVKDLFSEYKKTEKFLKQSLESAGFDSVKNIKDAKIIVENYDWGLKTTPWQHQAQAILFTLATLGIEPPLKMDIIEMDDSEVSDV